jgi:Tfp pilus assembly protein PilF
MAFGIGSAGLHCVGCDGGDGEKGSNGRLRGGPRRGEGPRHLALVQASYDAPRAVSTTLGSHRAHGSGELWSCVWGRAGAYKLRYVNIPPERVSIMTVRPVMFAGTGISASEGGRRGCDGRETGVVLNARSMALLGALLLLSAVTGADAAPRRSSQRAPAATRANPSTQVQGVLDEVADRLWSRADWYWHEGRYEERVAVDRLILTIQPRFVEAYGTAGWLLESLGRDDEALAMYRQGVTVAPERWDTHHDLAMYYYQHKEYAPAATAFRSATEQPGAPPYVWKMLAHALERSGKLPEAVAAWEAAGRVAPGDGAVWSNLRRVRARLDSAGG